MIAVGWYPDPERPGIERWWNGQAWSENRRPSITPQLYTFGRRRRPRRLLSWFGASDLVRSGSHLPLSPTDSPSPQQPDLPR